MVHITSLLVFFKTATLVLGGLITYFAYRAYERTGAPALRALAAGFGVVTLGSLVAGGLDLLIRFPILSALESFSQSTALVLESLFTAIGFLVILYSLYVE